MKYLLSLALFYFISVDSYSQLLEGKWKGRFTLNYAGREMYNYIPIELEFIISSDTAYSVFCYSQGHSKSKPVTIVKSKMYYEPFAKDSIYLSEIEIIDPKDATEKCLKNMYLRIKTKKNKTNLEGTWESISDKCNVSGTLNFWRKK